MLSSLSINNVALIKKQNIEFGSGFNVILGQSGAGKSIIIDALSFCLGAKADKNLIRSGETSMRVDAVFSDLSDEDRAILNELDIEAEDEIIITRTLSSEGKNSIKVNGYPATAKMLKDISEKLIDFCGQHDSVGLLNVSNHLAFLDKFAGVEVEDAKKEVESSFLLMKEIEKKISALGGDEGERQRTSDILQFQINEIQNANLKVGEEEELRERFNFISSAEKIYDNVSDALNKLDKQRESVTTLLHEAKSALSGLSDFKDIEESRERLESAYYELKDVCDILESVRDNAEYDPKELESIDNRLDLIKSLSKKYGSTIEDILKFSQECQAKLDEIENSQFNLEKLQSQLEKAKKELKDKCKALSDIRKCYAKRLEEKLTKELEDLQMKGTYFKINFEQGEFTSKGFDVVKFMFSANKGQELKDLHKTASGGELSRLLLAFKNVMLDKEKVQSVVFDEIDSGISGHTAGMLAEKLANISKYTQIICITHTPVVAAKADTFLLVEKNVIDNSTISTLRTLDMDEAKVEVARLIDGGEEVSQTALDHAKKLFN